MMDRKGSPVGRGFVDAVNLDPKSQRGEVRLRPGLSLAEPGNGAPVRLILPIRSPFYGQTGEDALTIRPPAEITGSGAYWRLNESGVPMAEASDATENFSIENGVPTYQVAGPDALSWRSGNLAIRLTGAFDGVQTNKAQVTTWTGLTGSAWTVSFWFKWDGTSTGQILSVDDVVFRVTILSSRRLYVNGRQSGVTSLYEITSPNNTVLLSTWQHVSIVRGSGVMSLYVDGALIDSVAAVSNLPTTIGTGDDDFVVGRRSGGPPALNLDVMDMAVFTRALALSEVQALAAGTGVPSP